MPQKMKTDHRHEQLRDPSLSPTTRSQRDRDRKVSTDSKHSEHKPETATTTAASSVKRSALPETKDTGTRKDKRTSNIPITVPITQNPTKITGKDSKSQPSKIAQSTAVLPKDNIKTKLPTSLPEHQDYGFIAISPLLIQNNDVVTVQFASRAPSVDDWIGAYTSANVLDIERSKTVPFLYGCCTGSCPWINTYFLGKIPSDNHYLTTGKGILRFNFTNIRSDIRFYYFVGNQTHYKVVAKSSEVVSFQNVNEPLKNRIVPTHDPNIFHLLWSTKSSRIPFLKWGLQSDHYKFISYAKTSKIEKNSLCGAPANSTGFHDLGTINTGIFNLSLIEDIRRSVDTTERNDLNLYYIFGDSYSSLQSKEFQFLVPPLPGQHSSYSSLNSSNSVLSSSLTSIAVVGDLGVGLPPLDSTSASISFWNLTCPPAFDTIASLNHLVHSPDNTIHALLHVGDLSYANGFLVVWDSYLEMLQPIISKIPYFTAVGNHEVEVLNANYSIYPSDTSGGECGVVNGNLFPMPIDPLHQDNVRSPWWSYEIGLFHITTLSTEHNYTIGSPQHHWLLQDMATINYSITPWVILVTHRSMYVSSKQCCEIGMDIPVAKDMINNFEDIIHKYHVNLAFAGHFHNLQRQSAVYQNKTITKSKLVTEEGTGDSYYLYDHPQSTIWINVGSSGAGPVYSDKNYSWSEKNWDNRFGYGILTAINDTTAEWKLIEGKTSAVLDHVYIVQDSPLLSANRGEPPSWIPTKASGSQGMNHHQGNNRMKLFFVEFQLGFGFVIEILVAITLIALVGKYYCLYFKGSSSDRDTRVEDSESPLLHNTPDRNKTKKSEKNYGTYPDEKRKKKTTTTTEEEHQPLIGDHPPHNSHENA
jgi:hypothetical protein